MVNDFYFRHQKLGSVEDGFARIANSNSQRLISLNKRCRRADAASHDDHLSHDFFTLKI